MYSRHKREIQEQEEESSSQQEQDASLTFFAEASWDTTGQDFDESLREIADILEFDTIIFVFIKQSVSIRRATEVLRNYHDLEIVYDGELLKELHVELPIGDEKYNFIISDSKYATAVRQIFIKTDDVFYPGTEECLSYNHVSTFLDENDNDLSDHGKILMIQLRAKIIHDLISCAEPHPNASLSAVINMKAVSGDRRDVMVFSPQQKRAAIALISFTQIAEVAPSSDWILETNGRSMTGDRVARGLIKLIANNAEYNFSKIFESKGALYLPSRRGGTMQMRDFERHRLQNELPNDIYHVYLNYFD